jgi:uncharacterized protein (DUF2147 family)
MVWRSKLICNLILLACVLVCNIGYSQPKPACDVICGKWMTTTKNLTVQVYREGEAFKAKIVWFDDSDDKTRPMNLRLDRDNPDKALRTRKVLGMNVLEKLVYTPKTNSWEHGIIYDSLHGRYWDSAAYITPEGLLKVTGYWHFKFIGKTLTFIRQ